MVDWSRGTDRYGRSRDAGQLRGRHACIFGLEMGRDEMVVIICSTSHSRTRGHW